MAKLAWLNSGLLKAGIVLGPLTFAPVQACESPESLSWLLGTWQAQTKSRTVTEAWQPVNPAYSNEPIYIGQTHWARADGSQPSVEHLLLVPMGRELFYFAKVPENPMPTPFKLVECTSNSAVFKNSEHDFPQQLTYTRQARNNLLVDVTGADGGGFQLEFNAEVSAEQAFAPASSMGGRAMQVSGDFEVQLAPQEDTEAPAGRMMINKVYQGPLAGTGSGQMLSKRTDGASVYAAIEEFTGTLAGKTGGFTLIHSGFMAGDEQRLTIEVVEGSGSGELAGISGAMTIDMKDGQHRYNFSYEF
jgi:hypothetical protein